jgi:pyruvate dehydrogenase E1 component
VRAWPGLIAPYLAAPMTLLGTDGFGRSDTRAALRRFFEIDRQHVVLAALQAVAPQRVPEATLRYGLDADAPPPWTR